MIIPLTLHKGKLVTIQKDLFHQQYLCGTSSHKGI